MAIGARLGPAHAGPRDNRPDLPQMALPVVVAAGGNTNFLADDFVYQAVLVGDASGPVAGEVVLERLRLADALVAVSLDEWSSQPMYNPISQLVYTTNRSQVTDVWVDGYQRVREGSLVDVDRGDLLRRAKRWADQIGK